MRQGVANLGVAKHSLYKWVQGSRPRPEEWRDEEFVEAKRKIPKMKGDLRRAAMASRTKHISVLGPPA